MSATRQFLLAICLAAAAGCGGGGEVEPDATLCSTEGERQCQADGVYECSGGVFELSAACDDCEAEPTPHCAGADPCDGQTGSICDGDDIRDCDAGDVEACAAGRCAMAGATPVCAVDLDEPCVVDTAQGEVNLACADEGTVSPDHVCDARTGACVATQFDCGELTGVPVDQVACDPTTGDFLTRCYDGQPIAIACAGDTSCSDDGTLNCYTEATPAAACGGQAICYPYMLCLQTDDADDPTCIQPAGQLACSDGDYLSVCTDDDTGFACLGSFPYEWDNLTDWGGTCAGNEPVIGRGGMCLPGIADCAPTLACVKEPFDQVGTCQLPDPDAPADCTLTGQASTGNQCMWEWDTCLDGKQYGVSCSAFAIEGVIVTTCDCLVDGNVTGDFAGNEVCNVETLEQLDGIVMDECGWDLTTTAVAD